MIFIIIYKKLKEWNNIVPRIYKLDEIERKISDILIRWRKYERKSWKLMLFKKEKEIELEEASILFSLYDLLQEISINPKKTEEIFQLIDQFILFANVGNFNFKIQILKFFLALNVIFIKFF